MTGRSPAATPIKITVASGEEEEELQLTTCSAVWHKQRPVKDRWCGDTICLRTSAQKPSAAGEGGEEVQNRNFFFYLHPRRKSNLRRQAEAGAKHAFCGCHVSYVVDEDLAIVLGVARLEHDADFLFDTLADILQRRLVIRLEGETVRVDHGQLGLRVRGEELLVALIQAAVVVQELNGRRWQVHDKVGDCGGHGYALWLGWRFRRVPGLLGRLDDRAVAAL